MEHISIFVSALLVSHIVFSQVIGVSTAVSTADQKLPQVLRFGLLTTAVVFLSTLVAYPIYLLLQAIEFRFIEVFIYVAIIVAVSYAIAILSQKILPQYAEEIKAALPIVVINSAVLGTLLDALLYALGTGLGFVVMTSVLSTIYRRTQAMKVPKAFKGLPILFITASLMVLALMGLSGII